MKQKNSRGKNKAALILNIIGGLLLVVVILACIPLTVPRAFGYQVYTVISGSMAPAIPTGSLVYVHDITASEVQAEDVIAFYGSTQGNAIITHRVVENQVVSGQFITKGDANEAEDMYPAAYDQLLGIVEYSIPVLGEILSIVATTYGKIAAACLVILAAVLHLIAGRLHEEE